MKNNDFIKAMEKPPIYTKTEGAFWDDEYISMQMLKAHLDPDFDAASRKAAFIDSSVKWINELLPPVNYPELLDIGCGPGLYAERFKAQGYNVTGVDYSRRSINYATESAASHGLDIKYLYQDYLKMDLNRQFDLCTFIYCDYGALSTDDRCLILNKVYDHLRSGGKLVFDVFTLDFMSKFREGQDWYVCDKDGFWTGEKHLTINGNYKYGNNVTLKQTTVVTDKGEETYYIWDTYFTRESLIKEAEVTGFKVCGVYGDVAGNPYSKGNDTLAIVLEK